jgi:hypothetical protein
MVVQRTCAAITAKGERCRAPVRSDAEFCVFHDPAQADVVQEARRMGGLRRRKEATVAVAYDFEGLENIPQIRRLIEVAVVRALGYLAQVAVTLLEKGEHEERLEAIEAALGPRIVKSNKRR